MNRSIQLFLETASVYQQEAKLSYFPSTLSLRFLFNSFSLKRTQIFERSFPTLDHFLSQAFSSHPLLGFYLSLFIPLLLLHVFFFFVSFSFFLFLTACSQEHLVTLLQLECQNLAQWNYIFKFLERMIRKMNEFLDFFLKETITFWHVKLSS